MSFNCMWNKWGPSTSVRLAREKPQGRDDWAVLAATQVQATQPPAGNHEATP